MKPKLILCLARGLVYTFALLMPYASFFAWMETGIPAANGAAKPPLWLELSLGVLHVALNLFLLWWYFTIPLALVIAAAFYWRQQLKSRITETSKS
jgi:hypothetical protein